MTKNITKSLTAKLFLLTVLFVLLAEILIFVPSVARYRVTWIEDKLKAGHLAALALAEAPNMMISEMLTQQLLSNVNARSVDLIEPDNGFFFSLDADQQDPAPIQAYWNIDTETVSDNIRIGLQSLFFGGHRLVQIEGYSPYNKTALIKMVVTEQELCEGLIYYAQRIALLSILISLITAGLLFLALRTLFLKPIQRITNSIARFKQSPDIPSSILSPSGRLDEFGHAEAELAKMQQTVHEALHQKTRLATLGTAMTKIQHDLRNILSTASLITEGLTLSNDPKARDTAERIFQSLDRADTLCSETLSYVKEKGLTLKLKQVNLAQLIAQARTEVLTRVELNRHTALDYQDIWRISATDLTLEADAPQLLRVFENLGKNAFEAGASHIYWDIQQYQESIQITITDDGEGLSPRAKEHLFEPFSGSVKKYGTGLGLPLSREIIRAHQGELDLISTSPRTTIFQIILPTHQA